MEQLITLLKEKINIKLFLLINLNAMIKMFYLIILSFAVISCKGQSSSRLTEIISATCNQQVYGTNEYIKNLPRNICIPNGFIIDDYVRTADLDSDGKNDFLAVKYNKKEDDQVDGDTTYWNFYRRYFPDTVYRFQRTLSNVVPPFIQDEGLEYITTNPIADKIFNSYPRRVNHKLSFEIGHDSLRLSYKFDDSYGKTFVFTYDGSYDNWYLENIEYFIGELSDYWWREDGFYFPLNDDLKVIEDRKPKKRVSIDQFDLKEAFRYRQTEWIHLAEWHVDKIDKSNAKSVWDVNFQKCDAMRLPDGWSY